MMWTTMGPARVAAWKTTPSETEVTGEADDRSRFIHFTVSWQPAIPSVFLIEFISFASNTLINYHLINSLNRNQIIRSNASSSQWTVNSRLISDLSPLVQVKSYGHLPFLNTLQIQNIRIFSLIKTNQHRKRWVGLATVEFEISRMSVCVSTAI